MKSAVELSNESEPIECQMDVNIPYCWLMKIVVANTIYQTSWSLHAKLAQLARSVALLN